MSMLWLALGTMCGGCSHILETKTCEQFWEMLKLADHEQLIFRLNNRQEAFMKTIGSYMASV